LGETSSTYSRPPQEWPSSIQETIAASRPPSLQGTGDEQTPSGDLPLQSQPESTHVGPIVAIANTFLVREVAGGMEILDQHALHERVNLEELRRDLKNGQIMSQALLVPSLVEVGKAELDLLLSRTEVFKKIGVDLEAFGEHTIAIRSVPARLTRLIPEKLVMDLLEIAQEHRSASVDQLVEESLHSMACRGAVMAGDHLDEEALKGLLKRGADLPQDRTCAHGRPVRVFLSIADLEKAFYRRV
jgi:DNA mismatch repair protein MutL